MLLDILSLFRYIINMNKLLSLARMVAHSCALLRGITQFKGILLQALRASTIFFSFSLLE